MAVGEVSVQVNNLAMGLDRAGAMKFWELLQKDMRNERERGRERKRKYEKSMDQRCSARRIRWFHRNVWLKCSRRIWC